MEFFQFVFEVFFFQKFGGKVSRHLVGVNKWYEVNRYGFLMQYKLRSS